MVDDGGDDATRGRQFRAAYNARPRGRHAVDGRIDHCHRGIHRRHHGGVDCQATPRDGARSCDLSTVRVGAVNGTTAEDLLRQLRVWPVTFATPKDALLALRARNIDAVVYDRPLLAWFVKQDFQSSIQLLDTIFDFQNYAFAVPLNSTHRKSIGVAVLDATESPWWGQTIFRYTGTR